ncbi:MAG: D-amino-acid transaminase [Rhodospirillales bacterium]|nr:D-amino-acid transaminase [Rhodospirillales bacterium]
MSRIAYVNGQYVPHSRAFVHIEDRGYQFADGVYEVFAVHHGRLIGQQGHLDRLAHSLAALQIDWPMGKRPFMVAVNEVVRRNHVTNGLVYIQITRGVARRDHGFPAQCESALVITARKMPALHKPTLSKGINIITIPDIRWKRKDIKSISLLPNCLGKQQAREAGAFEAWMYNEQDEITEGTSSNAWIVTADGELVTRDVSHSILNGITRLAVLEAAAAAGLTFSERAFSRQEAAEAKEAFITSSTSHVKAVTRIDDAPVGNGHIGEMTARLLDLYVAYIEEKGGPVKTDRWS